MTNDKEGHDGHRCLTQMTDKARQRPIQRGTHTSDRIIEKEPWTGESEGHIQQQPWTDIAPRGHPPLSAKSTPAAGNSLGNPRFPSLDTNSR
jgi:hypothetical protein